jgi:hypothetical protein
MRTTLLTMSRDTCASFAAPESCFPRLTIWMTRTTNGSQAGKKFVESSESRHSCHSHPFDVMR